MFNFIQCVKNIDFEVGTMDILCDCHMSHFRYDPVGHVITEKVGIIKIGTKKTIKQRAIVYREQNGINWDTDLKILRKSLREYKLQWALDEWEFKVIEIVKAKIDLNRM